MNLTQGGDGMQERNKGKLHGGGTRDGDSGEKILTGMNVVYIGRQHGMRTVRKKERDRTEDTGEERAGKNYNRKKIHGWSTV